ncbi:MAG: tyrosine-type recombinase/integrase [Lachnospiraceae bacterium]|nr:tyrosine-type recombinase/integrase [Lachnospiraceae bacterium]
MEGSINTGAESGKRNLTIVRPATRTGMRSGNIARLKLSEIDFDSEYISIIQGKTEVPLHLQMPREVSKALATHLENDKYSLETSYLRRGSDRKLYQQLDGIPRHYISKAQNYMLLYNSHFF